MPNTPHDLTPPEPLADDDLGRDVHVGTDPASGHEFMLEVFHHGPAHPPTLRISTRPEPSYSWSSPVYLDKPCNTEPTPLGGL